MLCLVILVIHLTEGIRFCIWVPFMLWLYTGDLQFASPLFLQPYLYRQCWLFQLFNLFSFPSYFALASWYCSTFGISLLAMTIWKIFDSPLFTLSSQCTSWLFWLQSHLHDARSHAFLRSPYTELIWILSVRILSVFHFRSLTHFLHQHVLWYDLYLSAEKMANHPD